MTQYQHGLAIFIDEIDCSNASKFTDCTWQSSHNCGHSEDVVLTCSRPINGWQQWGACSRDCNSGQRNRTYKCYGPKEGREYQQCQTTRLLYTPKTSGSISIDAKQQVIQTDSNCNDKLCPKPGSVRLFTGEIINPDEDPPTSGLLQVFFKNITNGATNDEGSWGTMCDDQWTDKNGEVLCRQLGFAEFKERYRPPAGFVNRNSMTIWIDDVMCKGWESRIDQCYFGQLVGGKGRNCNHEEDVFIKCATPLTDLTRKPESERNIARNGMSTIESSISMQSQNTAKQRIAFDGNLGNYTSKSGAQVGCSADGSLEITKYSSWDSSTLFWYFINFNATYSIGKGDI